MERKTRRPLKWTIYLLRVLKQVHPGQAISLKALTTISDMIWDAYNRIMQESETLLSLSKKSTIDARCIQTAVRLVFPGDLAKHAVSEGTKLVTRCGCHCVNAEDPHTIHPKPTIPKPKPVRGLSRSVRAGLAFPIGRIERKMREGTRYRVAPSAGKYLAAVLEYLAAEILELSGNAARDSARKRITPRNVMLAVHNDQELHSLFGNYVIAFAGAFPMVTVYFPTKIKIQPDSSATNINNTATTANTNILPSFN